MRSACGIGGRRSSGARSTPRDAWTRACCSRFTRAMGSRACLVGIYAGDLLLFLGGRFARRPVLRLVSPDKIARASEWISRRGMAVVFLSRFAPGLRLPTYVAAGLLKTQFWRFTLYFLIAAAIWTPLLVGSAALLGSQVAGPALS